MRNMPVRVFRSFEEEEKANREYDRSLTPDERFAIAHEIIKHVHGDLSKCPDVREYHRMRGDV
ncbi:MAG: hypothetical protein LDLANPLL_02713 [Turneriella sp.]|nr:hypothetical protein [Turneriella sp.]